MGIFSGNFGTGLITGLATGVDRTLKTSMDRRYEEMSDARKYLMTRYSQKADAAEERKRVSDKADEDAFDALHQELGDTDLTYAAFKRLGTAEKVQAYLTNVETARANLQPGQKYDAKLDFTGYTPGDAKRTRTEALSQIFTPLETTRKVSAADFAGITPPIFGDADKLADKEAAKLNAKFASTESAPVSAVEGFGTVKGLDFTRQVAAKEAKREDILFDQKVSAFDQNKLRLEEQMKIARDVEARAKDKALSDAEQRKLDNARNKVADLQRKEQLVREAEMFVIDKQAKKLGIKVDEYALQKSKEAPQFNDYEEMAVFYSNKLGEQGLTTQQKNDFEQLRDDAIAGAAAFNKATSKTTSAKNFSDESRTSVYNAAVKKELAPYGLIDELGAEIASEIEGNEVTYFAGMNRALTALHEQTSPLQDQQFNTIIKNAATSLKERVDIYKANPENLLKDEDQPQNGDEAYTPQFTSTLEAGDVVKYATPQGEVSMVWLGTRYYTPPQFGS